jgi:hypothetical protein
MIFLFLWIITILAGAFISQIIPPDFVYITGFVAGTLSYCFLQLFRSFKN